MNEPFLFSYPFDGRLTVAGGYFTLGGKVRVVVRRTNNRQVVFSGSATAKKHSITPGGAVYVRTTLRAPCSGKANGYARASVSACRKVKVAFHVSEILYGDESLRRN